MDELNDNIVNTPQEEIADLNNNGIIDTPQEIDYKQKTVDLFNELKQNVWGNDEYAGSQNRDALGQFYTPPELTSQMMEQFGPENLEELRKGNKTIFDPTAGSGNLLLGAYAYGAPAENIYGNEYDPNILENRLIPTANYLGIPRKNIFPWNAQVRRFGSMNDDEATREKRYNEYLINKNLRDTKKTRKEYFDSYGAGNALNTDYMDEITKTLGKNPALISQMFEAEEEGNTDLADKLYLQIIAEGSDTEEEAKDNVEEAIESGDIVAGPRSIYEQFKDVKIDTDYDTVKTELEEEYGREPSEEEIQNEIETGEAWNNGSWQHISEAPKEDLADYMAKNTAQTYANMGWDLSDVLELHPTENVSDEVLAQNERIIDYYKKFTSIDNEINDLNDEDKRNDEVLNEAVEEFVDKTPGSFLNNKIDFDSFTDALEEAEIGDNAKFEEFINQIEETPQISKKFDDAVSDIVDPDYRNKILNNAIAKFNVYQDQSLSDSLNEMADYIEENHSKMSADDWSAIVREGMELMGYFNKEDDKKSDLQEENFTNNPDDFVAKLRWKANWSSTKKSHPAVSASQLQSYYEQGLISDDDVIEAVRKSREELDWKGKAKARVEEEIKQEDESLDEESLEEILDEVYSLFTKREKPPKDSLDYDDFEDENHYMPPSLVKNYDAWNDGEWTEEDYEWYNSWISRDKNLPMKRPTTEVSNDVRPLIDEEGLKSAGEGWWYPDTKKKRKLFAKIFEESEEEWKKLKLKLPDIESRKLSKINGSGDYRADIDEIETIKRGNGSVSSSHFTPASSGFGGRVPSLGNAKFGVAKDIDLHNNASNTGNKPLTEKNDKAVTINGNPRPVTSSKMAGSAGGFPIGRSKSRSSINSRTAKLGGHTTQSGVKTGKLNGITGKKKDNDIELSVLKQKIMSLSKTWPTIEGFKNSEDRYLPFVIYSKMEEIYISEYGSGYRKRKLENLEKPEISKLLKRLTA